MPYRRHVAAAAIFATLRLLAIAFDKRDAALRERSVPRCADEA